MIRSLSIPRSVDFQYRCCFCYILYSYDMSCRFFLFSVTSHAPNSILLNSIFRRFCSDLILIPSNSFWLHHHFAWFVSWLKSSSFTSENSWFYHHLLFHLYSHLVLSMSQALLICFVCLLITLGCCLCWCWQHKSTLDDFRKNGCLRYYQDVASARQSYSVA